MVAELAPDSPVADLADAYHAARERMMGLIDDASLLTSILAGSACLVWAPVDIVGLLRQAVHDLASRAAPTTFALAGEPGSGVRVLGDAQLVGKALSCLLWTAACCLPAGRTVRVGIAIAADRVDVDLGLDGGLLPSDVVETLFEVCGQRRLSRPGGDLGLAPVLGRQIVRLMGGDAEAIVDPCGGSMIRISFRGAENG